MGVTVSVLDIERYQGKRYLPSRRLLPFPSERRVAPGTVAVSYSALPTGRTLSRRPDNMFWWVDAQFLPYCDSVVVTSIGAYLARPGRCSIPLAHNLQGLLYTLSFHRQTEYNIIKGSSTSAMPNVHCHPSSRHICYAGSGSIQLMNLYNHQSLEKVKSARNNQFRNCDISPNGLFVTTIAKCSRYIELSIDLIDRMFLISQGIIDCHRICPGFLATTNYTDLLQCRFSPDSDYVAASTNLGYLFVASRKLQPYCNVVPGMFDRDETRPANERSFDFNPCFGHSVLALGTDDNKVLICDLGEQQVIGETLLDLEGSIQCVKYSHSGDTLAVATSEATIHLHHPDSLDILYTLDGTAQTPGVSMLPMPDGNLPEILRLSYSTVGEHMAVSSTDGVVRVWQLQPAFSLQNMCRQVILRHVPPPALQVLPLPEKVIKYLLEVPATLYY